MNATTKAAAESHVLGELLIEIARAEIGMGLGHHDHLSAMRIDRETLLAKLRARARVMAIDVKNLVDEACS